jgi:DNA-binding LacI/PurR family transcriptional regulator
MPSTVRDKRSRPATLADVARRAGVVAMTASRAINDSGYVSDEVRKRVLKAARQLNYSPSMPARQLRGNTLHAIGILLPDIANPFCTELVNGARQIFDGAGYTVFITTTSRSSELEVAGLHAFCDHRVDGIIVATRGTKIGDSALKRIALQRIPMVTIGRPVQIAGVDSVTADHSGGAFAIVRHLLSLGHTRIGFIGISPEDAHTLRRYGGYVAALQTQGITPRSEYTVGPPEAPAFATQEDGYEGMMRLARLRVPPTAVFARNDFAAIGAMRAAHQLGRSIPHDIAVAGFDNIPMAAYATPPLTTADQSTFEQGATAARFLLERITTKPPRAHRCASMNCTLIVRESTDPRVATVPVESVLSKIE